MGNGLPSEPQPISAFKITTISQPQPAPPHLVLKNQEKEREALFNLINEVSLVAQSSQPAKALIKVNGRREWRDAPPNWVSDRIPTRLLGIWIESCGIPNIIRPIEQNGNLATTITQNEKITDFNRPAYYFLVDPSGSHYALLEVSWAAKEAIIFNSMNCSQDEMERLLHAANGEITQLCDSFHPSSKDKRLRTTSYVFNHQNDFSSCGFYAMHYIKQRIAGKNPEQIRTEVPNIAQFKQSEIQKLKSHIDSMISPERIRLHREYIEQNVHEDTEEYIKDQMGFKKLLFSAFADFYHV